jgi:hypothetical protein
MVWSSALSTAQVLALFTDEITAHGGSVTDTFDDGERLLARSVLPAIEEVRPGDQHKGGVALKATARSVCLYPYLFRLVCKNGAIVAEALETRSLDADCMQDPEMAEHAIRQGIEACCTREVFSANVRKARTAAEAEFDMALHLLPFLSRFQAWGNAQILQQLMERFFREGDRTRFGLANAVTSLAHDTRDPEQRWNLEELGGAISMGKVPVQPMGGRSSIPTTAELVSVG